MNQRKYVLISGASSGIGEAIARSYANCGNVSLILVARRLEKLKKLASELHGVNDTQVIVSKVDVASSESVGEFEKFLKEKGIVRIDILINNAGFAIGLDKIIEGNIEDWEKVLATNVTGVLRLTRLVLPQMVKAKTGHIVNIGSIAGKYAYEGAVAYCASKRAVQSISETLRLELLGTAVRVSCIDPGLVETDFSLVRFKGDEKRAKSVYENFRVLTSQDIAECVVFATTRPSHVNIDQMLIMPTDQVNPFRIYRPSSATS